MNRKLILSCLLLSRISSVYRNSRLILRVKRNAYMVDMVRNHWEVDLVLTTNQPHSLDCLNLRTSPTHWYCAAEYVLQRGEPYHWCLLDDPSPFRDMVLETLNAAGIHGGWLYVASAGGTRGR